MFANNVFPLGKKLTLSSFAWRRVLAGLGLLFASLFLAATVQAQVLDQIEMRPAEDGEKEIVLRFFQDVALMRYSPEREGSSIRIYFRLLADQTPISALGRESLTGPIVPGIPKFNVRFPEADTALVVNFDSLVNFRVRQIRGTRTISLFIRTNAPEAARPVVTEEAPRAAAATPVETAAKPAPASVADKGIPVPVTVGGVKTVAPQAVPGIPDVVVQPGKSAPATAAKPGKTVPQGGVDVQTQLANLMVPAVVPAATPAPGAAAGGAEVDDFAPVSLAQVEPAGKDLLEKARGAMAVNDPRTAIKLLNHLLNLPSNGSTREAQELIGLAREKNGELAKARSEFEIFVRLYPDGADTNRVKAHLGQLQSSIEAQAASAPLVDEQGNKIVPKWMITGSLSQNFYSGNSHIEILTPPPPGLLTFNQQTLSLQDQNALVSNLDIMARRRDGSVDSRIVVRESYTQDFLHSSRSLNRLSAAYFEQSDQKEGYQYRLGRQSGTYGSIGLFDGAFGAYQVAPNYRVSASAGQFTQFVATPINRTFWGVGLEKTAKPESIGGTLYVVEQFADSYVDRKAVGLELRYFDMNASAFSTLDYDVEFKRVNLFMMQANYRFDGGTNMYLISDTRRSPMLQLSNALPAATGPAPGFAQATTIAQALLNSGVSIEELRRWAMDITATSHMLSGGVTTPLSPKWQVGADAGLTSMSSSVGAGSVPAQPASGNSSTLNLQVIGNGVLFESDSSVINTTFIQGPTYTGVNYGINYGSSWMDNKLRTDLGIRYYTQSNKLDSGTMSRQSPTLRMSYRMWNDVSLEGETGYEKSSQTDGSGVKTDSTRLYFYMGYRWSFM